MEELTQIEKLMAAGKSLKDEDHRESIRLIILYLTRREIEEKICSQEIEELMSG